MLAATRRARIAQVARREDDARPSLDRRNRPVAGTFSSLVTGRLTMLPAMSRALERTRCRGPRNRASRRLPAGRALGRFFAELRPDRASGLTGATVVTPSLIDPLTAEPTGGATPEGNGFLMPMTTGCPCPCAASSAPSVVPGGGAFGLGGGIDLVHEGGVRAGRVQREHGGRAADGQRDGRREPRGARGGRPRGRAPVGSRADVVERYARGSASRSRAACASRRASTVSGGLGHAPHRRVDLAVRAGRDDVARALRGLDDVGEARVEGGEGEADDVRAPEVRDDARPLDERAADPPGLRVAQRDMPAARRASRGEATVKPCGVRCSSASATNASVSARPLAAMRAMPASSTSSAPASTAARPRIGGVPAANRPMPSTGS